MDTALPIGVVVIGRNEGPRLQQCLRSVIAADTIVVYVDSGSADGSATLARQMGADVIELDRAFPFTAARARNAGLDRLLCLHANLEFVQFVDGDCQIVPGWLKKGHKPLTAHPDTAIVAGRCRERFPQASLYHRLCDIEWNTPVGEVQSCGGIAMIRVAALKQVGAFNASLIAGEEPELCLRLRQRNWKILRIDAEMTVHDAAMLRFSQWWRRAVRAGHACAEGYALHGHPPAKYCARETRSIWIWAFALPVLTLALAWGTHALSFLLFLAYLVLFWRIYHGARRQRHLSRADARLYALFCLIGKFPQLLGQIRYLTGKILRRRPGLIEYKDHP